MLKAKNHKKLFSLMMSLAMVLSCITAGTMNVRADDETTPTSSEIQIKDHGGEVKNEADHVSFSKTIEGTDTENVFDITLKVETQQDIQKLSVSADAATVLVLDISSSMTKYKIGNRTRLEVMKESAADFIEEYAGTFTGDRPERLLHIVTFGIDAKRLTDRWLDVANEADKREAKKYIESITAVQDGTNIDAGLKLANANLSNLSSKYNKVNTNVIMLTDGCPNYYGAANAKDATNKEWLHQGQRNGSYTDSGRTAWAPVGGKIINDDLTKLGVVENTTSFKVKENAKLFSIAFATDANCRFQYYNESDQLVRTQYNQDPYNWLRSFTGDEFTFKATEDFDLTSQFKEINKIISQIAQAWTVTDPMLPKAYKDNADMNPIMFKGIDAEYQSQNSTNASLVNTDQPLVWNLRESTPIYNMLTKTYTYTLKYQIALDTTKGDASLLAGDLVETNGETQLDYLLQTRIDEGEPIESLNNLKAPIPKVIGMFGELSFNKVDEKGQPMENVTFKLEGVTTGSNINIGKAPTDRQFIAVSNDKGVVTFSNVPAGVYTLKEISTKDGYKLADDKEVIVSYGKTYTLNTLDTDSELGTIYNYPELKQLTIKKEWNWDNLDSAQGNLKPNSIIVKVLRDGKLYKQVELNETNKWQVTLDKLDWGDEDNNEYIYSLEESVTDNGFLVKENDNLSYDVTYASSNDEYTITNTYTGIPVDISGVKTWVHEEHENVNHPNILVKLERSLDGENWEEIPDLDGIGFDKDLGGIVLENGETEYTFTDIKQFAPNGQKYNFRVVEKGLDENGNPIDNVPGYETSYTDESNLNITNTYKPGNTSVTVNKQWEGIGVDPNKCPNVDIQLYQIYQNESQMRDVIQLGVNNDWTYTFNDLPMYAPDGTKYEYSVKEILSVPGFENSNKNAEGFVEAIENTDGTYSVEVVNTLKDDTTSLSVNKVWDEKAPEQKPDVIINLIQDGVEFMCTKLKDGTTSYTFTDLPRYKPNGSLHIYTVTETAINGYTPIYSEDGDVQVITNVYNPEKISISGNKTWEVPTGTTEFPEVIIKLTRKYGENGNTPDKEFGTKEIRVVTNVETGEGKYEFNDLEKYAPDGTLYVYSVTEKEIPNYTSKPIKTSNGWDFVNKFEQKQINLEVRKIWENINLEEDQLPEIFVQLYRNTRTKDSHEAIGQPVQLVKNNQYTHVFENLDQFDTLGKEYTYTVKELVKDPDGNLVEFKPVIGEGYKNPTYSPALNGYITITNTFNNTTVNIPVEKKWVNVPEGTVTPSITVELSSSKKMDEKKSLVLNSANDYKGEFMNLPKYDTKDGSEIVYTVKEIVSDDVKEGYTTEIIGDVTTGFTITNTYTGGTKVSVSGKKIWSVPEGIKVDKYPATKIYLQRSDDLVDVNDTKKFWEDVEGKVVNIISSSNREVEFSFDDLPSIAPNGNPYVYRFIEKYADIPSGYEMSRNENEITNTYKNETTDLAVYKEWKRLEDVIFEGYPTIKVQLKQNGVNYGNPVPVSVTDRWMTIFNDLPIYAPDGERYVYSVAEIMEDGKEVYQSPTADGYFVEDEHGNFTYTLVNTFILEKIDVEATKVWKVPEGTTELPNITFALYRDGVETGKTVELKNGETKAVFKDLQKYSTLGKEYVYTVKEITELNGYEKVEDGLTVTNTYTGFGPDGESIKVSGTKTWANIADDEVVPTITINLLQNGKVIAKVTLENGTTEYSFDNLPIYAPDGGEYKYDVSEDAVEGFESVKDGFNFTNTKVIPWTPIVPSEPVEPDEVLPDVEPPVEDDVLGDEEDPVYTGDNSQTTLFGMLGMLSLAGIVLLRKKKEEETK